MVARTRPNSFGSGSDPPRSAFNPALPLLSLQVRGNTPNYNYFSGQVSTDGGMTWTQAVDAETWSHQWWPPLSDDYQLSCRATDVTIGAIGDLSLTIIDNDGPIFVNGFE